MRYRNIEFLVSILYLYYSSAVVQPRKPFVQEISRKKDRTVFQCPPYIFPYILSPYVMHVLYRSTFRRSTVPVLVHGTSSDLQHACAAVPRQIWDLYHVFSAHVFFFWLTVILPNHALSCLQIHRYLFVVVDVGRSAESYSKSSGEIWGHKTSTV